MSKFYEVQLDIAIPDREGRTVKRNAGDVVPETEIATGSIESCTRLRQIVECEEPSTPLTPPEAESVPANGELAEGNPAPQAETPAKKKK